MTITISRQTLGDLLDARLTAQLVASSDGPQVLVFRGDAVLTDAGQPFVARSATVVADPSGRLGPYVVHYASVGSPGIEADLAEAGNDLLWSPLLHVSGGSEADAVQTVDRVHAALYRWQPASAGYAFGLMKPPPGYDPGPLRADNSVSPPRFWTPMQWRVAVTAA